MSISRADADAFFDALMTRDPARIAPHVADDAEWLLVGPLELFPYCGQHLGKAAVLDAYRRMGERTEVTDFARDYMVTDGETASSLTRVTNVQRSSGRQIVVRLAQFARFRDGQVYEFCSIIDTLGAAEQLTGRSVEMRGAAELAEA